MYISSNNTHFISLLEVLSQSDFTVFYSGPFTTFNKQAHKVQECSRAAEAGRCTRRKRYIVQGSNKCATPGDAAAVFSQKTSHGQEY